MFYGVTRGDVREKTPVAVISAPSYGLGKGNAHYMRHTKKAPQTHEKGSGKDVR
jgi:GTPase involved in cell partitioning and DNA repair